MKTRLCLIAFLIASAPAQAQLYKWVDEQGKVHYSDTPPAEKSKSKQTLNIPNQPAAPAASDNKSWQEKEQDFQKRRTSEAEAATKKQKEEQEAKTKQENCAKAQQSLSQLQTNAPVYTFNEKTGRTLLNEKQRADAIEKARKAVSDWCK